VFGVALAFLGMSVLVFALFRTFVPSLASSRLRSPT